MSIEVVPVEAASGQGGGIGSFCFLIVDCTPMAGETQFDVNVTDYGMDYQSVFAYWAIATSNLPVKFGIRQDNGAFGNYTIDADVSVSIRFFALGQPVAHS